MPRPFRGKSKIAFGGRSAKGNLQNEVRVQKGIVFLFTHDRFPGFQQRPNREIDEQNIINHFSKTLNFKIVGPFVNLKADEVKEELKQATTIDYSDYDCIVVVVISQYNYMGNYLTIDGYYTEDDITQNFNGINNPSIILKPKLFFLQASKATPLFTPRRKSSIQLDGKKHEPSSYSLPTDANFFIVRSSLSFESENGGTLFIEQVCEHLIGEMSIKDEILNVLKSAKEKKSSEIDNNLSILPDVTSTLTYKLYLNNEPKYEHNAIDVYDRNQKNGCLYIFNYSEVYNEKSHAYESRLGTDRDWERLKSTFERLQFEVHVFHDLTKRKLIKALESASERDLSLDMCMIVAIFTHGYNGMLGTYDKDLDPSDVFDEINEVREGMPKIFIFQVCRGKSLAEGVQVHGLVESELPDEESEENLETDAKKSISSVIDSDAVASNPFNPDSVDNLMQNPLLKIDDMIVLHSASKGNAAVRDKSNGTWLIQELCAEVNRQTPNMTSASLTDIFTAVQQKVALKTFGNRKQMPVYTSTLTKQVIVGRRTNL